MKNDFGIWFWTHIIFIIAALSVPFWLDWRIVAVASVLLFIQYTFLNGCILSKKQFGDSNEGFWYYYLSKIFSGISRKCVDIFTDFILPLFLVVTSYFLQK